MERKKIDFSELLFDIRKNLKLYSIVVALAFIVGLLFSFSIPKEYEANVILAPESSGEDMGGNISSLASMVGVNLGVGGYSDAYYPEIYPEIFHSNDFIIPLWSIGVENLKGNIKTTLYEYMLKHQKTAWWNYPRSWINIIIRSFSSDNNDSKLESKSIDTFHLTEEQNNVTNAIKGMVNLLYTNFVLYIIIPKYGISKRNTRISVNITQLFSIFLLLSRQSDDIIINDWFCINQKHTRRLYYGIS